MVRAGPVSPDGPARMLHAPGIACGRTPAGRSTWRRSTRPWTCTPPTPSCARWAAELLGRARQVSRGLDQAAVTGYQVCVRPMPADGQSIAGWLPGPRGVYLAVTHSGVTLAAHLAGLITS